jgi:uncharacterized protein
VLAARYVQPVTEPAHPRRELPETLLGLVALAVAVAVVLPVTALIVVGGIRDIKRSRDTVVVTGSARYPIAADLAIWQVSVAAQERTPAAAIGALRTKAKQVDLYLARGGVRTTEISKPTIRVAVVSIRIPTGLKKPAFRTVPAWRVSQGFSIQTRQIGKLERIAAGVGDLLASGTDVSVSRVQYLSTRLKTAKFEALERAVRDARDRAATIAAGLGARLGSVKQTSLGVYQITPRNSTAVSDYGINDTSSRLKEVQAVVSVTFRLDR